MFPLAKNCATRLLAVRLSGNTMHPGASMQGYRKRHTEPKQGRINAGEDTRVTSRSGWIISLIFVASLGTGCSKSGQSSQVLQAPVRTLNSPQTPDTNSGPSPASSDADLVRQAIEDHVRNDREINISALEMSIDSVNLEGDRAQAKVTFRASQGGATMTMIYFLERRPEGWQVRKGQPADGQFVHPPIDQSMSPTLSTPARPDIQEFLKNHPATGSN
jgi:hypothetical protein